MVKLEWGVKRTCQNCASRFYDLQRSPISCPKCGSTYEIVSGTKRTRSKGTLEASKMASFDTDDALLDQELDVEIDIEESIDDDLIEDASDLDEDLDEVTDVTVEKDEDEI